jgi:predicted RNA-binding protein with PUA domain
MSRDEQDEVNHAIQACRDAGLPVVEPDACTCGLRGQLVVLARPDGLRVVWPYHQRCPIHAPVAAADTGRAKELARSLALADRA